ncbi:MAG: AraC family transcriptional regulator [Bacteroidetes bacterium]|nr:AraC family transcriptional regulator [Bacteroidota bacterium]MCL2303072.1 AraC family transcriptional regulator [Lentimicrobiaceae bacterium]
MNPPPTFLLLRLLLKIRFSFLLSAFCFLLFSISGYAQNNNIISQYKHLGLQQLLDTANFYFSKNSTDTALICYGLLINTPIKDNDIEHKKRIVEAFNKSAVIYLNLCDYRTAYELLIKALTLCEKINDFSLKSRIYNNIGNIYYRFNKYDIAKLYYSKALELCQDSIGIIIILNNLGAIELENEQMDSAYFLLSRSLGISKQHNSANSHGVLNNIASLYEKRMLYDSAFYYYQLSSDEARKNNKIEALAQNLSDLGNLFFKINKIDSALFYMGLSNTIAEENNFLRILSNNYFTLSKIEESKGRTKKAFEYFKLYSDLKDSVLNVEKFGEINQLQRLYEISKVNQQIEQLVIEQQINERTIRYQKIIQFITFGVLLLVGIVLLYIFFQKRRLNTAYKALFEKNLEIMNLQEKSSEKNREKIKKKVLVHDMQDELIDKILNIMEDTSIICDAEFSIDKLVVLVHSNYSYVSQTINNALHKNFRSLLNSYRIREAQRLFSEPDATKYTIESVGNKVGFKSRTTFYDAFKEITGVSPNFYLKSMREQYNS